MDIFVFFYAIPFDSTFELTCWKTGCIKIIPQNERAIDILLYGLTNDSIEFTFLIDDLILLSDYLASYFFFIMRELIMIVFSNIWQEK